MNENAFEELPSDWTPLLDESELIDGKLAGVRADGAPVLLVATSGDLHAIGDRCSHRGCLLHEGRLNPDATVTCPCHGSTFRLDGSIVRGPATAPQPRLQTRTNDGEVEVRADPG